MEFGCAGERAHRPGKQSWRWSRIAKPRRGAAGSWQSQTALGKSRASLVRAGMPELGYLCAALHCTRKRARSAPRKTASERCVSWKPPELELPPFPRVTCPMPTHCSHQGFTHSRISAMSRLEDCSCISSLSFKSR